MRIAFLGVGAMGSRMARRLLAAGHEVQVWNRTAANAAPLVRCGATLAATPRAAVGGARLAISMVRDDEASGRLWLDPEHGALDGLPPQAIGIECSTLSLAAVGELAARFRQAGKQLLDAPVLGSRPQAEAGRLIHLVGGEAPALQSAIPALEAMGAAIHHVGPNGAGAALKLIINALFGVQIAAIGELIGAAKIAGLDPARVVDIIAATPIASPALISGAQSMLARSFAPAFPTELIEKDLGYFQSSLPDARAPLSAAARAIYGEAIEQGYRELNLTAVAQLYA